MALRVRKKHRKKGKGKKEGRPPTPPTMILTFSFVESKPAYVKERNAREKRTG
jgi:hypothetical protein